MNLTDRAQRDTDPILIEVLRAVGWYPGRDVSTEAWESRLRRLGYTCSDSFRKTLAEYGGLHLRPPLECPGAQFGIREIVIDPMAVDEMPQAELEPFEFLLAQKFTPIGLVDTEACLLYGERGIVVDHPGRSILIEAPFRDALGVLVRRNGPISTVNFDD